MLNILLVRIVVIVFLLQDVPPIINIHMFTCMYGNCLLLMEISKSKLHTKHYFLTNAFTSKLGFIFLFCT